MAISNTKILIKRSSTTATPTGLLAGEVAYSYTSNTLFLGNAAGTGVVNIGGLLYTQTIDAATNVNTANTLVKRDASGNFSAGTITAALAGNATTATTLQNAQNFSITGGDITASAVSFNGSSAVALNASLNAVTGLTAGVYGGTTAIPVVQVAANGRIMAISNTTVNTSFTVSGNTGSGTQNGGGTLTVQGAGGSGVTTTVTGSGNETITISTDGTFVRSGNTQAQSVAGDFQVAGNLTVSGTVTTVNTSTVITGDSLIKLAANNTAGDVVDIGFYGASNTGAAVVYHGLIREGSGGTNAGNFYLFKNLATDPTANVVNYAGLTKGTLYADLTGATGLPVSTGISGLGTGVASALSVNTGSAGAVVLYNGALGTPSSATLTNATGLPISGITGLGTGVATALAAAVTGSGSIALSQNPTFTGTANFSTINTAAINVGTTTFVANNVLGSFTGNLNSYEQFIIQNSNNGSQASVDFVVNNNLSTDTTFYGDYGMNSSGFTGTGSFNLPNAVYLASANTDLAIGTYTSNAIHFVVNSGTTDAMTISSAGVVTLGTALAVGSGGTGSTSFTTGQRVTYNGTSLVSQANTGTPTVTGYIAANSTITSVTTNNYGEVTAYTGALINIDASQVGSGTFGYSRGGTGSTSYTTGALLVAGPSGLTSLANTTYTATGSGAANNTISSLTIDAYGRATAATYSAISGLTVAQGGTGASTFTTNGIVFGNGTGALGVTATAAGAGIDQAWTNSILTVTNAGVPVWASNMDGGTF